MTTDVFSTRLLPGERILWSGRPATGILFAARDFFLVPFSLLWLGFVVFWMFGAASAGGSFALFGLVFVAFGLFFTFGRFFVDAGIRARTSYALTDRRALISRQPPFGTFQVVALDRLPELKIDERADGRGTVSFGPEQSLFNFGRTGMTIWIPSVDPTPQFIRIPDARRVFDLVQNVAGRA